MSSLQQRVSILEQANVSMSHALAMLQAVRTRRVFGGGCLYEDFISVAAVYSRLPASEEFLSGSSARAACGRFIWRKVVCV